MSEDASAREFETFYRENFGRVFRAALLAVGSIDEAKEISQESFLRIWASWPDLRDHEKALPYTLRTASNLSTSYLRRLLRLRRLLPAMLTWIPHDDPAGGVEALTMIFVAIRALPARQRWAVALCDVADLSTEEAAQIMGVKPSTLRVHLARARGRLRAVLSEPPDGESTDHNVQEPHRRTGHAAHYSR